MLLLYHFQPLYLLLSSAVNSALSLNILEYFNVTNFSELAVCNNSVTLNSL